MNNEKTVTYAIIAACIIGIVMVTEIKTEKVMENVNSGGKGIRK